MLFLNFRFVFGLHGYIFRECAGGGSKDADLRHSWIIPLHFTFPDFFDLLAGATRWRPRRGIALNIEYELCTTDNKSVSDVASSIKAERKDADAMSSEDGLDNKGGSAKGDGTICLRLLSRSREREKHGFPFGGVGFPFLFRSLEDPRLVASRPVPTRVSSSPGEDSHPVT